MPDAVAEPSCPTCGAIAGAPCVDRQGNVEAGSHPARIARLPKKVWLVMDDGGNVDAAFEDGNDAQTHADAMNAGSPRGSDGYFADELYLYPQGQRPTISTVWTVRVDGNGELITWSFVTTSPDAPLRFAAPVVFFADEPLESQSAFGFCAQCTDKQAAIYSVTSRREWYLAEKKK